MMANRMSQQHQTPLHGSDRFNAPALTTLTALLDALDKADIRYCRWKGNHAVEPSLGGESDLDLLVAERQFAEFAAILLKRGFKMADTPTSIHQPGVFHFLGNDPTGKLTNIHVYSRIVVGEEFVERWALPLERVLLTETRTQSGLRLSSPEAEFVSFVLRDLLRRGSLLDLALLRRKKTVRQRQISWLFALVRLDEATALLRESFPEVDPRDFARAVELIQRESGPLRMLRTARRVRRSLRKYRRRGVLSGTMRRMAVIAQMLVNRLRKSRKHMRLVVGGKVIAVIGPPATGKSTIASSLRDWLGTELEAYVVHAGKPPPGLVTYLPTVVIPALRLLTPSRRTYEIDRRLGSDETSRIPYLYVVRKLMLAWDRRRLLAKAFRRSRRGAVVIADRYPSDRPGAIDSLSFSPEVAARQPWLKRVLMLREARIYREIASPDLVIRLSLPVETAVARNIERDRKDPHSTDYVLQRHSTVQSSFRSAPVVDVSTDAGLDETLLHVKSVVWSYL